MARSDRATRSAGSSWVSPWRTTRFWYCIVNNWTYLSFSEGDNTVCQELFALYRP